LPCLRQYRNVSIDLGRALWVVYCLRVYPTEVSFAPLPLRIAGFPVYTFPGVTGIINDGMYADPAVMDAGNSRAQKFFSA
jgi:hypothetical protein